MTAIPQEATRSRRLPLWFLALMSGVIVVLIILGGGMLVRSQQQVSKGPAPDFTLETFDGEIIRLSDFRGTPVIINFWASWCLECYREAPILEDAWRRHKEHVMFIGVDYVDTEPAARAYLRRFDITYPNGMDKGNRISDAYRIQGVPETFFVDRNGVLQGVKIGPITADELEAWIQKLISE